VVAAIVVWDAASLTVDSTPKKDVHDQTAAISGNSEVRCQDNCHRHEQPEQHVPATHRLYGLRNLLRRLKMKIWMTEA